MTFIIACFLLVMIFQLSALEKSMQSIESILSERYCDITGDDDDDY